MTDADAIVVWQANYTPFGQADIVVENVTNNIRFPGQYYDQESGLHYNWHRYYDNDTGRYITSDPLGLDGGINTYGYAYQNPIMNYDPDGRLVWLVIPGICAAGGCEALVLALGGTIWWGMENSDFDSNGQFMAGLQKTRNSVSHGRENEIISGFPGGGCDGLEAAIRDLNNKMEKG